MPGSRFQGEFGCGVKHPDDVLAPEIGVFAVAGIAREREMVAGEAADFLHRRKLAAQGGPACGVGADLIVRPAFPRNFQLPADGLAVEMERLAGREKRQRR